MLRIVTYFLLLAAFSPACWAQATSSQSRASPGFKRVGIMPTIKLAANFTPKYNGIRYNGGPIIDDASGVKDILTDFIQHLGGSPNFNINTTYYGYEVGPNGTNVVKDRVISAVHYMGSTNDNYSQGVNLSDDGLQAVIVKAITEGSLPLDRNGVYFVLTSADVNETSGYCVTYCAFHGYLTGTAGLDNTLGAFVGNPEQCPSTCAYQSVLPTPNMNVGADTMASFIAHELEESITDPFGTGWVNSDGSENADMCLGYLGKTYTLANGSYANMKLGERQYLIQGNWVNANGGYCALKWDE
jgi:hypothetical protein